jgi:predicted aspartyl protease
MKTLKSLSSKRILIEGTVNGKKAIFLIDTGATVSLIDKNKTKTFGLVRGNRYNGKLIGAGGDIETTYVCNTFVDIHGKTIAQFLLSDISNIVDSIRRETGYEILGIIGLPQLSFAGIQLDINDMLITIE